MQQADRISGRGMWSERTEVPMVCVSEHRVLTRLFNSKELRVERKAYELANETLNTAAG